MRKLIATLIDDCKKSFVSLFLLELIRGLLIVLAAWLMQLVVIHSEFASISILFVILSLRILVESIRSKNFNRLSLGIQREIRNKLHRSLFTNRSQALNSGELLTLIFDTVESFDELIVKVLPNVMTMMILLPLILIVSAIVDPLTALIFLITLPIAPFLLYLVGQAVSEKNQRAWLALSKLNGDFKELLSSITTLKIFQQSNTALSRLKSTSEQSAEATLEVLKLAFVSSFALELITTLSIALIAVTVGLRLVDDKINFEIALFLLILAPEFYSPIRQIGVAFHAAIKAKESAKLIQSLHFPDIDNNPSIIIGPLSIQLIDVSFVYPNKISPTLENVNMEFKIGVTTAVTGESGVGKSTLLKLLAGLNRPTTGEIIYNAAVNDGIAYVPQQPHLFNASIRDNLTVFQEFDEDKLSDILKEVNLELNLDDKLNALSRGQLQRLGLARALLRNPSILILDEPTAGLDVESEEKILHLLRKYGKNKTLIIATHRQAVIEFADEIISLDINKK